MQTLSGRLATAEYEVSNETLSASCNPLIQPADTVLELPVLGDGQSVNQNSICVTNWSSKLARSLLSHLVADGEQLVQPFRVAVFARGLPLPKFAEKLLLGFICMCLACILACATSCCRASLGSSRRWMMSCLPRWSF